MKETIKAGALIFFIIFFFYLWLHIEEPQQHFQNLEQGEKKEDKTVTLTRQTGEEVSLSMDAYLYGVIASEMPASFSMEALKAQCVAARTYVIQRNYAVDDTTRTQVYHDDEQLKQIWGSSYSRYKRKIQRAIKETKNEIMTYHHKPISALFYSSSCGRSANAEEYWQHEVPYLKSVDSSWDQEVDSFESSLVMTEQEFASALGFQNPVSKISKQTHYKSGYVKSITIDGITFSGREVRERCQLRSSCFTIEKNQKGYKLTTKGYGHGVGMSQQGAQQLAQKGWDYQKILHHYYTDIKIEQMDV